MDLIGGLERSLGEKVKPMITQCSIRHLYALKELPQSQKDALISVAKNMERRRCNHHTLDEPLSTLACFQSVIDPRNSLTNRNRYIVASQDEAVRRFCRGVKGVPLVFVRRSVMIMEPMAESTVGAREGLEKSKFRSGLRGKAAGVLGKRNRDCEASDLYAGRVKETEGNAEGSEIAPKKKIRGPKGPNPLAVKKPKKNIQEAESDDLVHGAAALQRDGGAITENSTLAADVVEGEPDDAQDVHLKRTRKRKRKPRTKEVKDYGPVISSDNAADGRNVSG